jgi:hypothetical protein
MSFLESLQQLDELHDSKKTWTTTTIIMNIIDDVSENPRTSTPTNVAAFIGQRKGARGPKGEKKFFADFNDNSDEYRADKVFPAFKKACRPEGFFAISKGYENMELRLRIVCNRAKQHEPSKTSKAEFRQAEMEANDWPSVEALLEEQQAIADRTGEEDEHVEDQEEGGDDAGDAHDAHDSDEEDSDEEDDDDDDEDSDDGDVSVEADESADGRKGGRKGKKRTKTNRPLTKGEKCRFQFPIYWDPELHLGEECWLIK